MKQFFKQGWVIASLLAIFVSSTLLVILFSPEKAYAIGEQYTLYYNKDDVNSIQAGIDSPTGTGIDNKAGLYSTAIYARLGVFGKQVRFDFSNILPGGYFVYKYTSSCTYTHTPADQPLGRTGPSTIDITWALSVPLGKNFDSQKSYSGALLPAELHNPALDGTGIPFTYDSMSGDGKSKCFPGLNPTVPVPATIRNYQKLSKIDQNAWNNLKTSLENGIGTNANLPPANSPDPNGTNGTGTNCQGGALGWVLCPLINYMTQGLRAVAGLIDGLMQVRFLAQDSSSNTIETAWRAFLSVANILLVIAFMVIIFSQSTSLGLSNYGIKRMLPRLVIAAILMNISFYICALAIDVSNIAGSSIMGFLVGSGNSIAESMTRATGGDTGLLGSVTNVGISAVLVFIAIMFLAPVMLTILLVFIMLVGRQVVLMMLVLVSPLAFVAWLLPNTEQYFKKWYGLFSELLILYPLVMLVFGASLYMANVIGGSNIFDNINLTPFGN